jgi:hypothetical protein
VLSIFLPLLGKGYLFALDHVWVVYNKFPHNFYDGWLWFNLLKYCVSLFLPTFVVEKIWYILISGLCLFGGATLLRDSKSPFARLFAAILYLINPFTYGHFLVGQTGIIFSYALFPFFIRLLFDTKIFDFKSVLKLSILGFLIVSTTLHFSFILLLIILSYYLLPNQEYSFFNQLKNRTKILAGFGLLMILFNLNWFIPTIFQLNEQGVKISSEFNEQDLKAFRTRSTALTSVWTNVLSLQGFWVEDQGKFKTIKDFNPHWWRFIFFTIFSLVVIGIISNFRNQHRQKLLLALFFSSVLAYFLAIGVSSEFTNNISTFLYQHLPFYKGMREPHKWVMILALSYAYFGGLGVERLLQIKYINQIKIIIGSFLILLPMIYVPLFFWGFNGQFQSINYPTDWYQINDFLKKDQDNFQILFLPWHQYFRFKFTNKVHVNPALVFFERKTIQGDNIEFLPYIYSQSIRPESKYIESFIGPNQNRSNIEDFGKKMKELNIKYILLAKEVDWGNYRFLDTQSDLKKIMETDNLLVFQNLAWRTKDQEFYFNKYEQKIYPGWFIYLILPAQGISLCFALSYLGYVYRAKINFFLKSFIKPHQ